MIDSQKYSIILPGRVVEYYPENQTADVQICAESISNDSETLGKVIVRAPLEGVPVHTPSGGGWSMTMPIKKGNTCILFFSQVGYDHWLYEDKDKAGLLANMPKPWLRRKFHEDDGFAFVGLNTIPTAIKSYSPEHSQWRNEDAQQKISLNADGSIEVLSPTQLDITVEGDVNLTTTGGNLVAAVDGDTTVNATGAINLKASGDLNLEGANVNITGATINLN